MAYAMTEAVETEEVEDGRLGVADLCRMFEDAEEASDEARKAAERDRDYYDNKQLTTEEIAELRKRGQPEVIINYIKRKVDYLLGLEKQQRTMPKGLPRTPMHQQDAEASTDALRYVAQEQRYQTAIRSPVWRNMLIEGTGACCVTVEQKAAASNDALMSSTMLAPQGPQMDVKLRHYMWDRIFVDPHSSRADCSDANYLGVVIWMDLADAIAMYGEDKRDILETTMNSGRYSDTYDDTPKWRVWGDTKRRRVRVVQIWIRRAGEWYFAEYTKAGILKAGPSPHKDKDGKTDCELVVQSAYVDRDNNRYGAIRELISPQDEINKRRSKALHILNTAQVVAEDGAVADPEEARRQIVRPDGWVRLNPGGSEKFRFETRADLAEGQFKLLEHSTMEMQRMGANAAMMGDQGKEASGRAILASQQGGMIEMGDLLDNLRQFDHRVFVAIWNRIRQYWTAPMWVRVTDDERNVRFAVLNGAVSQDGRVGPQVAQLDVDITIDDAPDGVAPQIEQFQSLVELKKYDANNEIPFRVILEAMPNLRNKDKLMDLLDKREQAAAQQGPQIPPEVQAMQAKLQLEQQSKAQEAEFKQAQVQADIAAQREKTAAEIQLKREQANADMAIAATKAESEMNVARMKAEADMQIRRQTAERNAERADRQPAPAA